MEFDFEIEPDEYRVTIWEKDEEIATFDEMAFPKKGKVIYTIVAHWEKGSATYAFSLHVE